jgi:hypothetical protein
MMGTTIEGWCVVVDLLKPSKEQTAQRLPPWPESGGSFVAWAWSPNARSVAGWQILPDGKSGGITLYEPSSKRYRKVTDTGIYPTWLPGGKRLLFAADGKFLTFDLDSSRVSGMPTPTGFANDFALSSDGRWLYFAEDQREGNVWLIALPPQAAAQ